MYLYVQKWESLTVYLKLLNPGSLDFQNSNHCNCFFMIAGDLDRRRGEKKGCDNEVVNCEGVGGLIDRGDTSRLV